MKKDILLAEKMWVPFMCYIFFSFYSGSLNGLFWWKLRTVPTSNDFNGKLVLILFVEAVSK